MTAKEKAIEIAKQYWLAMGSQNYPTAIKCAIIHVKGIIETLKVTTGHLTLNRLDTEEVEKDFAYWQQVLHELNQM